MTYAPWLLILVTTLTAVSTAQAQPISVPAEGGSFQFNVKLRVEGAPIITGTVTNQTDRSWITARFTVDLFNNKGERIQNPMLKFDPTATSWRLDITNLTRAQTIEIGVPGWGTQMSGRVDGRIGRFELKFIGGEYEVDYKVSLLKPSVNTSLTFEDEAATFSFQLPVSRHAIVFTLHNKLDEPVRIDWNQVSYVDMNSVAHRVIHEGVRLSQRDQPMSPTTVPPGAKMEDRVYPSDAVRLEGSEWIMPPLFPAGPVALSFKGKTFSVFLPLEVSGKTRNYNFVFSVDDVQAR